MLIAFVYQNLLHCKISKKCSKIEEFSFFPNFVVKRKAFELTCDCLILYFPTVFQYRTYAENSNLPAWMYQKLLREENWKNLS